MCPQNVQVLKYPASSVLSVGQELMSKVLAASKLQSEQKIEGWGLPLVVQWLRLHAPHVGGLGSIPRGARSHMSPLKGPACCN